MSDSLKGGYTTGCCAAAAAQAATLALYGLPVPSQIELTLPDASLVSLPVAAVRQEAGQCSATIIKDAGDDPDVTHGSSVVVTVAQADNGQISFRAGEGVGIVTLPGLSIPPGEPAINPGPRRMIEQAVRQVTNDGLIITVAIPGGQELARKTFNPRLGISGGLSILGTTGRVRPFSHEAVQESIRCAFAISLACGIRQPVLVPGHIGARAAEHHLQLQKQQMVEVGNEWGYLLQQAATADLDRLLVLGHPGKLAKLQLGQWDTHSSRSDSAVPLVAELCRTLFGTAGTDTPTVEGLFNALEQNQQKQLATTLATGIITRIEQHFSLRFPVAVALISNNGDWLGSSGDISCWRGQN